MVWRLERKKEKVNYHASKLLPNISSPFLYHLHLTLPHLCGRPQGQAVGRFTFTSQSCWKYTAEVPVFLLSKADSHICLL